MNRPTYPFRMQEIPKMTSSETRSESRMELAGLDLTTAGDVMLRFRIIDESGQQVGNIAVEASNGGNSDFTIADGHRRMASILRQWLGYVETMAKFYEMQGAGEPSPK